jgi:hypothetical protein
MTREQIELLVGRSLSNSEWLETSQAHQAVERHPDADAILDRCVERGATLEELIRELARPPTAR